MGKRPPPDSTIPDGKAPRLSEVEYATYEVARVRISSDEIAKQETQCGNQLGNPEAHSELGSQISHASASISQDAVRANTAARQQGLDCRLGIHDRISGCFWLSRYVFKLENERYEWDPTSSTWSIIENQPEGDLECKNLSQESAVDDKSPHGNTHPYGASQSTNDSDDELDENADEATPGLSNQSKGELTNGICPFCKHSVRKWPPHIRVPLKQDAGGPQRCHFQCIEHLVHDWDSKAVHWRNGGLSMQHIDATFLQDFQDLLERSMGMHRRSPCLLLSYEDARLMLATTSGLWPVPEPRRPPVSTFAIEGIREIRISSCMDLRSMPPEIGLCVGMKALVLISNGLTELPLEVGHLCKLDQLFLNGNFLRSLPESVGQLPLLEEFCGDSNLLETLPPFTSPVLTLFTSPANRLRELPLLANSKLGRIELHGNSIGIMQLEPTATWGNLIIIKMMGNQLRKLPDELEQCKPLRALCVAGNLLESLPTCVARLDKLEWLFAYGNCLHELPDSVLLGSQKLDTVLLEGNPLSVDSLQGLIADAVRTTAKTVGLDMTQLRRRCKHLSAEGRTPLPPVITVGSLVNTKESVHYYMKLVRASQLRRKPGVFACAEPGGPASPEDVPAKLLVVAFSASQGEPEWLGLLRRILLREDRMNGYECFKCGNFGHMARDCPVHPDDTYVTAVHEHVGRAERNVTKLGPLAPVLGPLSEIIGDLTGELGSDQLKANLATLFQGCAKDTEVVHNVPPCGTTPDLPLEDFDVLSVIDHRMRWYSEDRLGFSEALAQVTRNYERILFVGASMGGFGALLHGGLLADVVIAFGPQTRVDTATLRPPGASHDALVALSERFRATCRHAHRRGARLDIHCAADEHCWHAINAPLEDYAVTVHPIVPAKPFPRILDRAGLLEPILIDAMHRTLTMRPAERCELSPKPQAEDEALAMESRRIVLARYRYGGKMERHWLSRGEVLRLFFSQDGSAAPRPGDWFCAKCQHLNADSQFWCVDCGIGVEHASVEDPKVCKVPGAPHNYPRKGDWGCGACGLALGACHQDCTGCGASWWSNPKTVVVQ